MSVRRQSKWGGIKVSMCKNGDSIKGSKKTKTHKQQRYVVKRFVMRVC